MTKKENRVLTTCLAAIGIAPVVALSVIISATAAMFMFGAPGDGIAGSHSATWFQDKINVMWAWACILSPFLGILGSILFISFTKNIDQKTKIVCATVVSIPLLFVAIMAIKYVLEYDPIK